MWHDWSGLCVQVSQRTAGATAGCIASSRLEKEQGCTAPSFLRTCQGILLYVFLLLYSSLRTRGECLACCRFEKEQLCSAPSTWYDERKACWSPAVPADHTYIHIHRHLNTYIYAHTHTHECRACWSPAVPAACLLTATISCTNVCA